MNDYDRDTAEQIITEFPAKRLRTISRREDTMSVYQRGKVYAEAFEEATKSAQQELISELLEHALNSPNTIKQ